MAERRYCKNTVPGRQGRGKKYPAKVRAEVVMAMIGTNSICAVARKYGVPESTIRSWVAEEAKKPDGEFAIARAEAAREIAARAALGAKAQVSYLQQRAAENQRAAEIRTKLQQRLDEDARARNYELGVLLKSEEENLQDAAETGLVIRSAPGTYDRQLTYEERTELEKQLERYESLAMSDKDAAKVTAVLLTAAEKAAALVPKDEGSGQSAAPAVLMERQDEGGQQEVVLDGSGTVYKPAGHLAAAAQAGSLYAPQRGRSAVRRGSRRRKERCTGDRSAAAGGHSALPRADRAENLPAAFGADRQDDAVLQAGIPESAVQRFQPRMDLSERGEDLLWQHVPHAGQIQLSGQSL